MGVVLALNPIGKGYSASEVGEVGVEQKSYRLKKEVVGKERVEKPQMT